MSEKERRAITPTMGTMENSGSGKRSTKGNPEAIEMEQSKSRTKKLDDVEDTPFIEARKVGDANKDRNLDIQKIAPTRFQDNPGCTKNLSYYFSQFCGATSIHGVQYLGERGRFMIEKIVWLVIISVVCSLCLMLISKTYHKWKTSPVMVTFATTETPIWSIPFPAVTICPEAKINPEILNYTDLVLRRLRKEHIDEDEQSLFNIAKIICGDDTNTEDDNENDVTEGPLFYNNSVEISTACVLLSPYWMLIEIMQTIWLGTPQTDALTPVLTSQGICFSFNMLPLDEILRQSKEADLNRTKSTKKSYKWSLENGYPDNSLDSYPRRTFLAGIGGSASFMTLPVNHSHLDYMCNKLFQGFKVALHHPSELPSMNNAFQVSLDQTVLVGILPKMTTVSEELKAYHYEDRKCYISGEKTLKLFSIYTQQNCLTECFYNYTLSKCGCAPFYLSILDADSLPTCGPGSSSCLETSEYEYMTSENNKCNCLPFCTTLEYNVEITQAGWDWRNSLMLLDHSTGNQQDRSAYENFHMSNLVIYYKELQFLPTERHELYGYVDFFSNVGGLLGLFIGFSVTSLIEIIYFMTLRLGLNIRKFGRNFWSGEPELINGKKST